MKKTETVKPEIVLRDLSTEDVARILRGSAKGRSCAVTHLGFVSATGDFTQTTLTFVTSPESLDAFMKSSLSGAIIHESLLSDSILASPKAFISVAGDPRDAFYDLHCHLADEGFFSRIEGYRSPRAKIHPTAVIEDHVVIADDVEIAAHAFIGMNTVICQGSRIGIGTVIGGDGFERRRVLGRWRVMPHVGGVFIDEFVTIGNVCTVDRHLWNSSTTIGRNVTTDAHVHIAHNCMIGDESGFAARAEVSGSCRLGQGVWFGPGVVTTHGLAIGDFAFAATGSVILKDAPSHARLIGNPARQLGWSCACRGELVQHDDRWTCKTCHKNYRVDGGILSSMS